MSGSLVGEPIIKKIFSRPMLPIVSFLCFKVIVNGKIYFMSQWSSGSYKVSWIAIVKGILLQHLSRIGSLLHIKGMAKGMFPLYNWSGDRRKIIEENIPFHN